MADWSDVLAATRAVVDPSTPAEDLASIAQVQKGLWVQIASHPNAYPGLLDWLSSQGDEAVRAAVASRQQQTQSSVPVPPPPPATEPPATNPAPKRLKKSWLIGGAGVLVVALAVVLVVVFMTRPASSILRYDQLQALADNLHGEDIEVSEQAAQEYFGDFSGDDETDGSCGQLFAEGVLEGGALFDLPYSSGPENEVGVFIFASPKDAIAAMDVIPKCAFGDQIDDVIKLNQGTTSHVSMSLWQVAYDSNQGFPMAVYANVLWFSDANRSVAWDEWQTYATTTFKSAVDQAIKS